MVGNESLSRVRSRSTRICGVVGGRARDGTAFRSFWVGRPEEGGRLAFGAGNSDFPCRRGSGALVVFAMCQPIEPDPTLAPCRGQRRFVAHPRWRAFLDRAVGGHTGARGGDQRARHPRDRPADSRGWPRRAYWNARFTAGGDPDATVEERERTEADMGIAAIDEHKLSELKTGLQAEVNSSRPSWRPNSGALEPLPSSSGTRRCRSCWPERRRGRVSATSGAPGDCRRRRATRAEVPATATVTRQL